jgi:hypothetical protein
VVLVVLATGCGRAPLGMGGQTPALEDVPQFSVEPWPAPESPSPLSLVQAGAVAGVVPDTWEARLLPQARFPQQGFMASPSLQDWERGIRHVAGVEMFWIDVAQIEIPSDLYYLVAHGPAMDALASDQSCRPSSHEVFVDHPPDFTGERFSPGDYVVSATGTCAADGLRARWKYVVAAPGFGPVRQVGIPNSGLYVVLAVVSGARSRVLLDEIISGARFGNASIDQIVASARQMK